MSRHAERSGQALQIVQRDVARLALHMRHEGAVQACLEGQRFLRPAARGAQLDQVLGQHRAGAARFGRWRHGWRGHRRDVFMPGAFEAAVFDSQK